MGFYSDPNLASEIIVNHQPVVTLNHRIGKNSCEIHVAVLELSLECGASDIKIMFCISTYFYVVIFLWCHIESSHFEWTRHSMTLSNTFFCIYIYVVYRCHIEVCTNDYFYYNSISVKRNNFVVSLLFNKDKRWYQQEHPWFFSSHGKYLYILSPKFFDFQSTQRTPTRS